MRRLPAALLLLAFVASCSTEPGVRAGDRTAIDGTAPQAVPTTTAPGADTTDEANAPPANSPTASGSLDWGDCTDLGADATPGLQCATLTVPLDAATPDGETIDLALVRLPVTDPTSRRGSIVFNPGDPGASGVDFVVNAGSVLQRFLGADVAAQYDLVGFDPRGVGRSSPIECVDNAWLDAHLYPDDTPDTPEEQQVVAEASTGLLDACQAKYGSKLALFSTTATADDMDLIRAALGDDQLTYYGASYGTYLGAIYATKFPDRVRAMVLDAAFDPTAQSSFEIDKIQAAGFEHAFNDWSTWCDQTPTCPFTGGASGSAARWDALRVALDATPAPAGDGRQANQSVLDSATTQALYDRGTWMELGGALRDAESGDGSGLFVLADGQNERKADGTYDSIVQSFPVISCASGFRGGPPPDPAAAAAELQQAAPRMAAGVTAEDLAQPSGCGPLEGLTPAPVSYSGAGPIMVVGGLNDPATPFSWAPSLTTSLGPSAVLVTYDGEGHGALGSSSCVNDAAATLFTDLTSPASGVTCSPDPPVARPTWFDNIPAVDGVERIDLQGNEEALGLTPTQLYAEAYSSTASVAKIADDYTRALTDAGFAPFGSQALPGTPGETNQSGFLTASGETLLLLVLDETAVKEIFGQQGELLAQLMPAGQNLVLLSTAPS